MTDAELSALNSDRLKRGYKPLTRDMVQRIQTNFPKYQGHDLVAFLVGWNIPNNVPGEFSK